MQQENIYPPKSISIVPKILRENKRGWTNLYFEEEKYKENPELQNFLEGDNILKLRKTIGENVIIVLGGDGTMLSAIRKFGELEIPFLGINFGHKGFLLHENAAVIKAHTFLERSYPLIECTLDINGNKEIFYAFNEIDIRSANGRVISLAISVNNYNSLHVAGDGLIVSTPAGSTGYNRSLGGPIIPHQIDTFVITPKAPWEPRGQGPILIPQEQKIEIKNIGVKNAFEIYGDGIHILSSQDHTLLLTIKKSQRQIILMIAENYKQTWDSKVMQEQGLK